MAIDGKAQKGRLKFEEEDSYPIHAVSIAEHETGIVLTQGHVERADTETKSRPTHQETKSEPTDQKTGKKGKPKGKPGELTEQEQELLNVYDALKKLAAQNDLSPCVARNVRQALASMWQATNDLDLQFEQLYDLGV